MPGGVGGVASRGVPLSRSIPLQFIPKAVRSRVEPQLDPAATVAPDRKLRKLRVHKAWQAGREGVRMQSEMQCRRRWELSQAGREIAAVPLLDDRDRDILLAIARRFAGGAAPAGIVAIAREVGVCNLTVRRRQPRRQELCLWLARPGFARYSVGVSCSVARQFRLELEDSSFCNRRRVARAATKRRIIRQKCPNRRSPVAAEA